MRTNKVKRCGIVLAAVMMVFFGTLQPVSAMPLDGIVTGKQQGSFAGYERTPDETFTAKIEKSFRQYAVQPAWLGTAVVVLMTGSVRP
jgi:hypothetical protein